MKKNKSSGLRKFLSLTALSALTVSGVFAYEVPLTFFGTNTPPLEFHGFLSQGYLLSSDYNYLANDTKNGSFQFTEMGLNVSMNPFPHTRIAAQAFDFDVGNVGQYHPFLDYALLEYTVNDQLGFRGGRIRRPSGLYNSIQDIDLGRTFILLPQGVYDARWRDWSAGLDGVDVFGNVTLHKAGSFSYEAYLGYVNMSENGGVARYIENTLPAAPVGSFHSIDSSPIVGAQLWYNTPIDGLRLGAAFAYLSNWGFNSTIIPPFGPGNVHSVGNVQSQQYSLEYIWKNWTFQSEYYTYDLTGHNYLPALGNLSIGPRTDNPETWYVGVSHRFNRLLEVGTYYTQFTDGADKQNDAALSFRFDLKDWWVFKVEGHYLEGTGLLRDNVNNPVRNNNQGWFMLAVKTTLSF